MDLQILQNIIIQQDKIMNNVIRENNTENIYNYQTPNKQSALKLLKIDISTIKKVSASTALRSPSVMANRTTESISPMFYEPKDKLKLNIQRYQKWKSQQQEETNDFQFNTSKISRKTNQNQDQHYLYWKNKAYEYQNENFKLLKENATLKKNIQQYLKQQQKYQLNINSLQKQIQKLNQLQNIIKRQQENQKHRSTYIKSLQLQLKYNLSLVNQMQSKICKQGINANNFNPQSFRLFNQRIRKLQQENSKYKYILKEQEEQLKSNGISSIWKLELTQNNNNAQYTLVSQIE